MVITTVGHVGKMTTFVRYIVMLEMEFTFAVMVFVCLGLMIKFSIMLVA